MYECTTYGGLSALQMIVAEFFYESIFKSCVVLLFDIHTHAICISIKKDSLWMDIYSLYEEMYVF